MPEDARAARYNGIVRLAPATILLLSAALLAAIDGEYASIRGKLARIESDRAPAGSRFSLTERELNAWARVKVQAATTGAVRNPVLRLSHGSVTGYAVVDFVALRAAHQDPPGWLLRKLIEGKHPVRVKVRVSSGSGRARIDVESAEISGLTISGLALDFLIRNFVVPVYPEVKVGEPFELGHRIDRLTVAPSGVTVFIGS